MVKDTGGATGIAVLLLAGAVAAQTPQWVQAPGTFNSWLNGAEFTYDHLHDRTVGFGGQSGYVPAPITWQLDGDTWSNVGGATVPPGRVWHAMAFDSVRGEVVMYGGAILGGLFYDTWVWDGTTWTQRFPAHTPPLAARGFMAYDEGRGVVVMLLGSVLWDWDGLDWTQSSVVPPLQGEPALAYDSRRARLVVYAGGVLHEFDGQQWTMPTPMGPAPVLSYPSGVYDRERGRCVFVGYDGTPSPATFEYDGAAWTQGPSLPAWMAVSTLVYDRLRSRIVMHSPNNGGNNTVNFAGTTWYYQTPGLAIAQPYGIACGAPALTVHEDPNARPLLGATFGFDIQNVPTGVAFVCFGWSRRSVLGLSLPTPMTQWGLPGCWLLQSDDAITLPSQSIAADRTRFAMAIPASPTFTGLSFHLQPWAPAPGLNPANAAIGDAIGVTIGAQ